VLKGYVGDKSADASWTGDYLRLVDRKAFDVLGTEGARPFEVATVRLQNMMTILPKWETLAPANKVSSVGLFLLSSQPCRKAIFHSVGHAVPVAGG
jgi:hypothetical protein